MILRGRHVKVLIDAKMSENCLEASPQIRMQDLTTIKKQPAAKDQENFSTVYLSKIRYIVRLIQVRRQQAIIHG